MYFLKTFKVHAPCHGVCCTVFDIDGMLFEFFKYWKKMFEKNKKFFNISSFLRVLCYFQHLKKKYFEILKSALHHVHLLQIVDRDSGNLYPIYILYSLNCSDFFLAFRLYSNIYRKTNSGNQKIKKNYFFSFNVFLCVLDLFPTFLEFLRNIEKCPLNLNFSK